MRIAHIQEAMANRYTKRKETMRVWFLALVAALLSSAGTSFAQTTDLIPPLPPTGLTATVASCGQVDLSWGAACHRGGQAGWWQRRNEVSSLSKARTGGREERSHESEEPDVHCLLPFRVAFRHCFLDVSNPHASGGMLIFIEVHVMFLCRQRRE